MTKLRDAGQSGSNRSTDYILPFLACVAIGPAIALAVCVRNSKQLHCPDIRKHKRIAAVSGLGVLIFSMLFVDYGLLEASSEDLRGARMVEQFKLLAMMTIAVCGVAWITELQMPAYRFRAANQSTGFDFTFRETFVPVVVGLASAIAIKQLSPAGLADPLSRLFVWYL